MGSEILWNLVAIFIALCALVVSICDGARNRRHNKKSVTPYICISGYWVDGSESPGITLENKGIGPAIISDIEIQYSNKKYNFISEYKEFLSDFATVALQKGLKEDLVVRYYDSGEYLAIGEKALLLNLRKSSSDKASTFLNALLGITITVRYKSVYGDSFSSHYDTLSCNKLPSQIKKDK